MSELQPWETTPRMSAGERQIVAFTSVAHGLNHAVELVYGVVLVVIAVEFGASFAVLGAISNASGLAYAAIAVPAGQAADRLGSRRMVALSMGGSGVAAALAAASPNVGVLAVALVAMGVMGGLYHPAGLSFITRGVRHRARALGFHGAGGNVGTALAPAAAGAIAGLWSWRGSFLVFAAVSLAVAVLAYRSQVGEPDAADAPVERRPPGRAETLLLPLALVFVMNAGFGFIFRGLTTFLPLHLSTNVGFDVAGLDPVVIGGSFATFALVFGVAGQWAGGELGERVRRERVIVPVVAVTVPALLLMAAASGWVLLAASSVFVFFNFLAHPASVALISDYAADRLHGRVYGLTSLTGFGVGSFAGLAGGLITESAGVAWVFVMLAGVAAAIVLTAVVLSSLLWRQPAAAGTPGA